MIISFRSLEVVASLICHMTFFIFPNKMVYEQISKFVDSNESHYIKKLAEVVGIPSVSGTVEHRPHVRKMGQWLESELKKLGASVSMRELGKQLLEGQEVDLPPVVLATYGTDPKKKTVLVYGHYDVQPAFESDGWTRYSLLTKRSIRFKRRRTRKIEWKGLQ